MSSREVIQQNCPIRWDSYRPWRYPDMAPLAQVRTQVEEVRPLRQKQCTPPCLPLTSQAEVRRSESLMLKPRPHYRLLNRSAIRKNKSITPIEEDAKYDDLTPIWRRTTLNSIAGEM